MKLPPILLHNCLAALVCLAAIVLSAHPVHAQTGSPPTPAPPPYNLKVAVDEVSLTFHAADAQGLAVNDLKLDELKLLDNGQPPHRIVAFQSMQDMPSRMGILIDTSESMTSEVAANRAIATQAAQHLLTQPADQAFVMDFGYVSKITQPWTSNAQALTAGIRQVVAGKENPLGGTALFDTLFRACFNVFAKLDQAPAVNFILLFSDGVDNASYTSVEAVVDACQRANTAIYAFRAEPSPSLYSIGPKNLADLAAKTGGRLFPAAASDSEIDSELRSIAANLRNQYRLVYNPAAMKHDGAFHRIELQGPQRVDHFVIRSGYYDCSR